MFNEGRGNIIKEADGSASKAVRMRALRHVMLDVRIRWHQPRNALPYDTAVSACVRGDFRKKKNPLPGDINATYGLARRSLSLVVSLFSIVTAQGKAKGRRDQLSQDENQERFRGDTEKYQDGGQ